MADAAVIAYVRESLYGLKNGEIRDAAAGLAYHYGVSMGTIYRWAHKSGLRWRKGSAAKGTSRVPLETLKAASALMYASKRANKQMILPACDAQEILDDSGVDTAVSASRFRARLRETGLSARDLLRPTPHRRLLSEHPNHVWQFDVTNCIQYFLDEKKGMGERDPDMVLYKNKIVKTAREIKKELLRYAVVDHCSGAFYFRYFYASGERKEDGERFLYEAMRPKDELIEALMPNQAAALKGKYPFQGVPFFLVPDKGSIMTARSNRMLLESLKVDVEPHLPGNPRAKGAVEGLMRYLNAFEARLRLERPSSLEELNAWALDHCIFVNAAKKFRKFATRSAVWSTITRDQHRLCPDRPLWDLILREPVIDRTCHGDCTVWVDGRAYQVPDVEASHRKVKVVRHPFEYPAIEVHFREFVWLCAPINLDARGRLENGVHYGEYHAPKHTEAQKVKGELEEIAGAWGVTFKGTAEHRVASAPPLGFESPLKVFGHQAEKVPENVQFMARPGTPMEIEDPADEIPNEAISHGAFEVPRAIAARRISTGDFLTRLAAEIGPVPRALNQAVKNAYPDGVEAAEVGEIVEEIGKGTWNGGRLEDWHIKERMGI